LVEGAKRRRRRKRGKEKGKRGRKRRGIETKRATCGRRLSACSEDVQEGRWTVNAPEVPHPPHPTLLRLLEQQLIIRRLLGQLQVLDVPLPPFVPSRSEVVRDVARQPGLLVEGFTLFRSEVEGGDAGEDEGTDTGEGDPLPPGSVEA
jgi:hypothetical protein